MDSSFGLAFSEESLRGSVSTVSYESEVALANNDKARSILDPAFRYVPSFATSVAATWRRFGWRPTTDEDRRTRRRPEMALVVDWVGAAECAVRRQGGISIGGAGRG